MYSRRVDAGFGLINVVSLDKYSFSDSKVAACCGPQAKSFTPHNVLRKGRLHSVDLEMNLFRAANLPVSCWTSLVDCGCAMLMIA